MEQEQQQEQQQTERRSSGVPYQVSTNPYNGSIIALTDPENQLISLELMYKGKKLDQNGEVVDIGTPLMNDKGVNSVMGVIRGIVSQVTIMGNLGKQEIPNLMDFIGDTLSIDLMMNKREYNIQDETVRYKIYFTALTSAFICLKRSYEEGDRRFWKGSTYEAVIRQQGDNQNQSFLSKVFGWGGKK